MKLEDERCDDAKVSTGSSNAPEQFGVVRRRGGENRTVSSDDFGLDNQVSA